MGRSIFAEYQKIEPNFKYKGNPEQKAKLTIVNNKNNK